MTRWRGQSNGRLLLRIEDIDAARCRPEYEAAIDEDLRWLGIAWQQDVRRQSEHFDDYQAALGKLEAMGLVYPSFESRSEIAALVAERDRHGHWPRDPDGVPLYPGRARKMPKAERDRRRREGEPFALRLAMDAAVARAGVLTWTETGMGPQSQRGSLPRRRKCGATPCWHARRCRPLPSRRRCRRCVPRRHRCRARAGLVLVDQPSTGCCKRCSACRSRSITTTSSSWMEPAASCRNRQWPRACASCGLRARHRRISGAWWGSGAEIPAKGEGLNGRAWRGTFGAEPPVSPKLI